MLRSHADPYMLTKDLLSCYHPTTELKPYESGGVSANKALPKASGYLDPETSAFSHALRISFSSSFDRLILSAPRFSSIRGILVVPGI